VAFNIFPIFALANTGITKETGWMNDLMSANSLGIMLGLIVGKLLGVSLFCYCAVITGICHLPAGLKWLYIVGAGILGGIGFTMSIFITNLAFPASVETINAAKMAILSASLSVGVLGFIWFKLFAKAEIAS
jgi:NhaA family Na+:H+ antiporter